MENIENLAVEEIAENTEKPVEETPKTYTEAEFNAKLDEVLGKKIARKEAKIRKEYERKYGGLEEVLKAGTGKETVEDITDACKQFYEKKGIQIAKKPTYSDKDIEILARAEADEIIRSGFDEVVEEVDRLADIGVANMTPQEKAVFKALAEYRQETERGQELTKIGIPEDVYNSKEFKDYADMYKSNVPIAKVYENFVKTQPKKEIKTMGSMKQTHDGGLKDFYTPEEAKRFTQDEINNNPALVAAIERSMLKW